jgi:hypothetical protein
MLMAVTYLAMGLHHRKQNNQCATPMSLWLDASEQGTLLQLKPSICAALIGYVCIRNIHVNILS